MKDQERARRHAQRRDQEMRQQIREILLEAQPKLDFAHFKPRRQASLSVGGTGQPGLSIYPVLRLDFVQKLDKL